MRALRITIVAAALLVLFTISQRITEARGDEPLPGLSWALGVVSGLFLVRAVVTERTQGADDWLQKDLLWGLAAGGFLTILSRWLL